MDFFSFLNFIILQIVTPNIFIFQLTALAAKKTNKEYTASK